MLFSGFYTRPLRLVEEELRPFVRRARCRCCRVTHALLPGVVTELRLDRIEVIGATIASPVTRPPGSARRRWPPSQPSDEPLRAGVDYGGGRRVAHHIAGSEVLSTDTNPPWTMSFGRGPISARSPLAARDEDTWSFHRVLPQGRAIYDVNSRLLLPERRRTDASVRRAARGPVVRRYGRSRGAAAPRARGHWRAPWRRGREH